MLSESMIYILIIIVSLVLSAIFSAYEAALLSGNPLKIFATITNRKMLKKVMNLFQDPSNMINSLSLSINLMNIIIAVFSFGLLKMYYSLLMAGTISSILTIFLTLVPGDILPKFWALYSPRFIITKCYFIVRFFMIIMVPFVALLNWLTKVLFPSIAKNQQAQISRKNVEMLFHKNNEAFHSQQLVEMIYRVLAIDNIRVREAKVPIHQMMAFSGSTTVREFKEELRLKYYSYFPIFKQNIFNIIGFVSTEEILFQEDGSKEIQEFQRNAKFIPESKAVDDAMEIMDNENVSMLFLIDEFGAVSGMVTKRDLHDLILGSSWDDKKSVHSVFAMLKEGDGYLVSGRQDVDDLNDMLSVGIKKEGFETLAGFVMYHLNEVPKEGDEFEYKGYLYRVKETRGFYCSKVLVKPLPYGASYEASLL